MYGKSLLAKLVETIEQHRAERRAVTTKPPAPPRGGRLGRLFRWFLPNGGTILLALILIATQSVWARSMQSATATSTSAISYQGRLADAGGNPLTGVYNLEFRVYDVPDGGVPLWEEFWTGGNSVQVSDGLFNVMLGSIDTTLAAAIEGHDELYLGITVGADSEMTPRVQLGSVPFSMQALTVADGSITTDKIADEAVTQAKLGPDVSLVPPAGSITTTMLANNAVTTAKIADGAVTPPKAPDLVSSLSGENLKIQYGLRTSTGGATEYWIEFPTPFADSPTVVATADYPAVVDLSVYNISSTGFMVRKSLGEATVNWIAIGP